MKVICFTYDYDGPYSSSSIDRLVQIGEWYDASIHMVSFDKDEGDPYPYYFITFNDGSFANLATAYFKTEQQLREEKLKELGI